MTYYLMIGTLLYVWFLAGAYYADEEDKLTFGSAVAWCAMHLLFWPALVLWVLWVSWQLKQMDK